MNVRAQVAAQRDSSATRWDFTLVQNAFGGARRDFAEAVGPRAKTIAERPLDQAHAQWLRMLFAVFQESQHEPSFSQ